MKQQRAQFKSLGVLAASALTLALASGFAQANPVATWSFVNDSTFSLPTWTGPAGPGGQQTVTPSELSWGLATSGGGDFTSNNRSALTIGLGTAGTSRVGGGSAIGTVDTTIGPPPLPSGTQIAHGVTITHWNNPISSAYGTLTGARITDTLTLTPTAPSEYGGQSLVNAPTLTFNFKFKETPNAGDVVTGLLSLIHI